MKHIKSINEFYHRTMGFRYSEPALRFSIACYYQGQIDNEGVTSALDGVGQLKFEKVNVVETPGKIKVRDMDDSVYDVDINGTIFFDILIYSEREIDKIMEDLTKSLAIDYKVRVVDVKISELGKDK